MAFGKKWRNAISRRGISRRDFLAAGLVTTAACFFPRGSAAAASKVFLPERSLSFYNTHTGEHTKALYWHQGAYVPQALAEINYILRDHRTGEVKEIDTDLLDLLFALRQRLQSTVPFEVISGYRSPETNSFLVNMSRGVAPNSLHIQGKAVDIRLAGYDLKALRSAAVDLGRGGVGYYPSSDFVHVDVGNIRSWER
jgi:uncharacterized protein YcbK (DUF882 family)